MALSTPLLTGSGTHRGATSLSDLGNVADPAGSGTAPLARQWMPRAGLVPVLALARFDIPWVGHAVRDLQRPTVHLALIVGAPLVWALLCIWSIWRPVVRVGLSRAQARRGARPSRQAHH